MSITATQPTVTAIGLPVQSAVPAAERKVAALPKRITMGLVPPSCESDPGDTAHVTMCVPNSYDPEYQYVGEVVKHNEYDGGGNPHPRRLAAGASVESAIAAAALMSKEITDSATWNQAGIDNTAIGVFQADSGRLYLGALWWASEQNGNDQNLSLTPGTSVRRLSPELLAVVSDAAIARFA